MTMTKEDATNPSTIEQPKRAVRAMRSQPIHVAEMILERASRCIRLRGEGDRVIDRASERETD